jgi:hypothetical protein
MIEVKVLGVGCANCKTTQDLIEKVCDDNDIAINLEKIRLHLALSAHIGVFRR